MSKEIYISSTPHETRLAIVESDELTEIYYERENEYTLAGSIYNGKVTRVLPGMQSSFVDIGLERDAFLYITDFMEEEGDSADFDSDGSQRGNRAPRESRENSRLAPRPSPGDGSAEPVESASPRSSERNGRGDRGRRRGRDDRGQSRDRQPTAQPGTPPEGAELRGEDNLDPTYSREGEASFLPAGNASNDSGNIGEGAPGADGSRRWRGRRGRRRGRGARDESQQGQQQVVSGDTPETTYPTYNSSDAPEEDLYDLDASAAAPASEIQAAVTQHPDVAAPLDAEAQTSAREDSGPAEGSGRREDRSRGDRGGRDRGRRDRNDRDRPRSPRGFEPSRSLYGVDSYAEPQELNADGSAPEPIVLPGESLAKYRKGGVEETETRSSAADAPLPTPEFVLPSAWDGGDTLPGETRQRRPETRSGNDRSFDRHPERNFDRNRDRDQDRRSDNRQNSSPAVTSPAAAVQPAASAPIVHDSDGPSIASVPKTQPEIAMTGNLNAVPASEILHENFAPESHTAPVQALPVAAEPELVTAPSAEYEPDEEAVASLRFDPATRREFRQAAPQDDVMDEVESSTPTVAGSQPVFLDPLIELQSIPEVKEAPSAEIRGYESLGTATAEPVHSIAHSITPQPGAPFAPLQTHEEPEAATTFAAPEASVLPEISAEHFQTDAPSGHEFTAIGPTGEMLSEVAPPVPQEDQARASPMHHETAVIESDPPFGAPSDAALVPFEDAADTAVPQNFAPGTGALEEELMEEDEFDGTLNASSVEEMDYEEETLEGAADLGTMIREMSIDEITRTVSDPEEDEYEEEDAIDDGDFADSEDSDSDSDSDDIEAEQQGRGSGEVSDDDLVPDSLTHISEQSFGSAGEYAPSTSGGDREGDRRPGGRRDSRRDGRRGDRSRGGSGDRARSTGGSGDRSSGMRSGRRDGRHSAQTTNLPAISDLLKPGQEVLVQIAKEPIAKKGARITSHIALPGRFLVFMPTVNHTGVSRKIESDGERRRLKEILLSEKGEASGGFIVRTAASGASEEELRSDLRFLLNLWSDIKQRSESSKSPALIYHDLNLVERVLRDQVTDTFSAIWVDTETEYERVLRFLQRFQPSLIRRVKLYTKDTPLFEQFGITEEINKALRSKVWLKSGGSIVINQTEALVAIDINTGKYVGKTARLEDTIVKTNLDAIPEIVRQIRLRDLGGIIIIDFIDMDERKNRMRVMQALEEELKNDRAPSKILQFNDFGLVAITRKRVKQSLERTLSTTCNVCVGTGMVKSPVTVCNDIYIEMRKMQKHLDRGDVMLRVHPEVVKQLKSTTKWLQEMEEMIGKTILVKSDPSLHPEQFDIH